MDIRISPDIVLARERGRPRRGIFTFLALAVATVTVVLLINPATTEEYAPVCGLEEHVHTEACMETVGTQVCPFEESEGHIHGEECYEMQSVLICELEENEEHQHTEECWAEKPVLICQLPEGMVHEHTEDCIVWEESYICGLEDDPDHVHTDECVERIPVFVCEQEEGVGHVHNDLCYVEKTVCVCGLTEHTHTDECYPQLTGDPHADVEIDLDWESTFCDVELTGSWADDLIAIARSQLGYKESELNFVTDEYNVRHGYTRYGEWNGTKYSGWNGLYVMFCLHYAHVKDIPADPVPANWMNAAAAQGFWKEELPVPGDLAFFDDDADGLADRVGIVSAVWEDGFDMISGGTGKPVEEEPVSFDSEKLAGYLALPQNPDYVTLEEKQEEAAPEQISEGTETLENTLQTMDLDPTTAAPGEAPQPVQEEGQPPVREEAQLSEREEVIPSAEGEPVALSAPDLSVIETPVFDPYAPVTLYAETESGITATMEAIAGSFGYPEEELVLTIAEVENEEGEAEEGNSYDSAVQSIDTLLAPDGKRTAVARLFDISIWHKEYEEVPAEIPQNPADPATGYTEAAPENVGSAEEPGADGIDLPDPDQALPESGSDMFPAIPSDRSEEEVVLASPEFGSLPAIPSDRSEEEVVLASPEFGSLPAIPSDRSEEEVVLASPEFDSDTLPVIPSDRSEDVIVPSAEPYLDIPPAEPVSEFRADDPEAEKTERPYTLVQIQPMGPVQVTVEGIGTDDWTDYRVYRINQYGEVTELAPDATRPGSVTVTTEVN